MICTTHEALENIIILRSSITASTKVKGSAACQSAFGYNSRTKNNSHVHGKQYEWWQEAPRQAGVGASPVR